MIAMSTACTKCSGKGYVRYVSGNGKHYFDKCPTCRGSKIEPRPIGDVSNLAARRLITAAEVRRRSQQ